MGSVELLKLFVIGLYLAGTILSLSGILVARKSLRSVGMACAVAGFALHTFDMGLVTSQPGNSLTAGAFYYSLFSWLLLLIWFLAWWRLKLGFLALTISPLALLFYISSLRLAPMHVTTPPTLLGLFFGLHIGALFLALALLAVSFGAGLAFLHLERKIKTKEPLTGFRKDLPSLSTFDRAVHWAVAAGFPLYTVGLLSGFFWAKLTWGKVFSWDIKELTSITIWFLYASLFYQRMVTGRQGRRTAILAIWVFALAMLSMLGINLLTPSHHSFTAVPL
ncbi:cytochrome C assembly family protein [Desulfocurvibacter africanus]|uniref:cytochrome C assembly family protein n=1 Tax=Desulfocurvibacter africanus TaxID=873 RepID=UPI0003FDA2BA|nr:cytochrome c biogenesis protein CcsA [Desulfocurvibacter africanus]